MKKILGYGLGVLVVAAVLLAAFYAFFPGAAFELAKDMQRRAAGLATKEIQIEDHRIVYLEGGEGEPVILLHGFGGNRDHWTAFARHLKDRHLVILDIPGFGESSRWLTASYDIESQVERIDRFAEALGLETFHMAGNSMGGALAAGYAARYPEKVLTLALMNPAGAPSPNKSDFVIEIEKGNNPLFSDDPEDFDKLIAMIFSDKPIIPAPFRKIMAAEWAASSDFNRKIWKDMEPHRMTLAPVLPQIQAPVLVIWGEQDNVLDVGGVAFLETYLKNSRTIVMEDTGHCPMIEKPEETADIYGRFLREKG